MPIYCVFKLTEILKNFSIILIIKFLTGIIFRRKRKMLNPTRFSFHFMLPCRIIFIPSNCNYTCQNKKNISYVQLNNTEEIWHIFHSLNFLLSTRLIKSSMLNLAYSFKLINVQILINRLKYCAAVLFDSQLNNIIILSTFLAI